ncbi:hypothetical protein WJX81_008030 [Elliptochloris bilobata]|uniref:Uncharacterized protein n=1 Tax=Elliptochloris bilobata TaxID=381761 RepID=A0AAW1RZ51_9CHLO
MKVSIELDIEPHEVDLATELINALRQLTDHVRVRSKGGEVAPLQTPAAAQHAPPRPAGPQANGPPGFYEEPAKAPAPAIPAGFNPAPQRPHVVGPPPPAAPRPPAPPPAPPPPAPAPPQQLDRGQIMEGIKQMLRMLEDPDKLPDVTSSMEQLLKSGVMGSPDDALLTLLEAFSNMVFDPEHVQEGKSVVPYMSLLPRLPDEPYPFKTKMRDALIPKVLKHLTAKRAVAVDRTEFFAHAEAFASLVQLDFVSIPGAVQTIITLLKKPENRCAAVTMLGKTVEMCYLQLGQRCAPADLAKLQAALTAVSEPLFDYDKQYICEFMGWAQPGAAPAPAQ